MCLGPVKSSDSMHDLLFLVLSCLISPEATAGTVYQFPASVKVRSGERVSMSCQLNEVQSFCHRVAWVRVHPVSGITDVLQDKLHQNKEQPESSVCRFSIHGATVQDSGMYYCIATDREHMYLGNGTAVTVQADNAVMPSIDIMAFASSKNHGSTVTLQCAVGGFASSQVHVHWLIGSRKDNGRAFSVWEEGEEVSVKTHNYAAVSAEEWRTGGACTCVVKFSGWMFNKTLHYHDIQDTCYPLVSVSRIFALVTALLFLTTSAILAGRL